MGRRKPTSPESRTARAAMRGARSRTVIPRYARYISSIRERTIAKVLAMRGKTPVFNKKQAPPCGGAHQSGGEFNSPNRESASAPPDEGHLGGHDGHELNIGVQRQAGHVHDGTGHMFDVHQIGRASCRERV